MLFINIRCGLVAFLKVDVLEISVLEIIWCYRDYNTSIFNKIDDF